MKLDASAILGGALTFAAGMALWELVIKPNLSA